MQFLCLAAFLIAIAGGILVLATQGTELQKPILEGWEFTAAVPFALAIIAILTAIHCARHAYLILTPLGIEIFPFFKPEKTMQLITWGEVQHAEISSNKKLLSLHFNSEKTSGIIITLSPILAAQRQLLHHAITGLMNKRNASS